MGASRKTPCGPNVAICNPLGWPYLGGVEGDRLEIQHRCMGSGLAFFWVLRFPSGDGVHEELHPLGALHLQGPWLREARGPGAHRHHPRGCRSSRFSICSGGFFARKVRAESNRANSSGFLGARIPWRGGVLLKGRARHIRVVFG